ncbi:hypothetical protein ACRRTK_013451 [Alexandromys fortis]
MPRYAQLCQPGAVSGIRSSHYINKGPLRTLKAGSRDDGGVGKAPQKGYGQAWVGHSVGFHKPTAVYERDTHRIRRTVLITTMRRPLLQALGLAQV